MLFLKAIGKIYEDNGGGTRALADVSLDFPGRGMVFILGKSGSGKSTLLNLIAGIDSATSGEVVLGGAVLGKDIAYEAYRNTTVGFIFQEFNLEKSLNAEQNVLLSERLLRRDAERAKALAALDAVGLSDKAKKKINQLSGGERQRLAVARALIKDPKLILADEPTGKLDEVNGAAVFDLLKKLSCDRLVIVVSHDRASAEKYADRIIELSDGRVVSDKLKNPAYTAHTKIRDGAVYMSPDGFLNQTDADIINASGGLSVALSKETAFIDGSSETSNAAPPFIARGIESRAKKGLRVKDSAYIAAKNLLSRRFKTLGTILICSILFAVVGLASVILTHNQYQADARTFINNSGSDITLYKYDYSYGYPIRDTGKRIEDHIREYLKAEYPAGYSEIYRLNGFDFPDYLINSEGDSFTSLSGVYETDLAGIEKFGYKLMRFDGGRNVFADIDKAVFLKILGVPDEYAGAYELIRYISSNLGLFEYFAENPDVLPALLNYKEAFSYVIEYPFILEMLKGDIYEINRIIALPFAPPSVRGNREFADFIIGHPEIIDYIENYSEFFEYLSDSEYSEFLSALSDKPSLALEFASLPSGLPAWLNPFTPIPDAMRTDPLLKDTPGFETAETLGDVFELLGDNYPRLSYESVFPETGVPVSEYDGGQAKNQVVVTDFLAYILMRQISNVFGSYHDFKMPKDGDALREFLNSGYEASLLTYFNVLNAVEGFSNLRIVGVLDTGFKEKYFEYLDAADFQYNSSSIFRAAAKGVGVLDFLYYARNYYLMLYTGGGFSENCYAGELKTPEISFSKDPAIIAFYEERNLLTYASGRQGGASLSPGEIIMTENAFLNLFGFGFDPGKPAPVVGREFYGVDYISYKVVGVIKNTAGLNLFERAFGIVASEDGFSKAVSDLSGCIGIRLEIDAGEVSALFAYMEKNHLYYASAYSFISGYAGPSVDSLKSVFLPLAILLALISVAALSMFLVNAVMKKAKGIGTLKALGAKTSDVIKIYLAESAITIVSVLLLSSLAAYLIYLMTNAVFANELTRMIPEVFVKRITLFYLTPLPFVVNISAILTVGVFSAVYPAAKIARLSPVDAMRRE